MGSKRPIAAEGINGRVAEQSRLSRFFRIAQSAFWFYQNKSGSFMISFTGLAAKLPEAGPQYSSGLGTRSGQRKMAGDFR